MGVISGLGTVCFLLCLAFLVHRTSCPILPVRSPQTIPVTVSFPHPQSRSQSEFSPPPLPPPSFKLSHVRHFISTLRKVMTIRLQQYERWGTYTLRPQRKKDRLTRSLLQQRELRKSTAHLRMSCLGSSCGLWTARPTGINREVDKTKQEKPHS